MSEKWTNVSNFSKRIPAEKFIQVFAERQEKGLQPTYDSVWVFEGDWSVPQKFSARERDERLLAQIDSWSKHFGLGLRESEIRGTISQHTSRFRDPDEHFGSCSRYERHVREFDRFLRQKNRICAS